MKNICEMTALEISTAIKNKEITVEEAVNAFFDAIDKYDTKLHCYNTVCKDEALKRAKEVQQGIDSGKYTGRLAGVPIGVKDNICTKDILTTCSSKILENFIPTYNATVINRLNDEGMVVIGKLNMDEFAMGSTTETSATGVTHNPWDVEKVPGGSSGGAAAAVAASLVYGALDICVSVARAAVDTLPNVFSILLALCGAKLLLSMRAALFSDEAVDTAQRLSRLAVISLKASVISSAAFNAVQIALAGGLSNVNVSASIPFAGVLFALLALIFSRFIAESKRIKDDNDSII